MKTAIGIDLGGTTIKGAIIGETGVCTHITRVPTGADQGGRHVLSNIMDLIGELINKSGRDASSFVGVGFGTPGFVGADGMILGGAENLPGWKGTQVYAPITERFGLRVSGANDVTSVALAELKFGAGRGVQNIVCFALGTGVGGGIATDGKIYKGTHGMAGEIGHIVVETDGAQCTCGRKGCVEAYASATGIVKMAVDFAKTETSPFAAIAHETPAEVTSKMVYDYVAKGDALAMKVHHRMCDMLSRAIGTILDTLSPDRVILGGGVMMAGDVIIDTVKTYTPKYCWPAIYERCEIVIAQMGEDAGVLGAGALALEEFV
ncbi:MAG: ROK family protein [Chitinispirillales bacterium]|jgi:glucokinase|nr:ROK family protein [Chitinispirillales bacterium]